MATVKLKAGKVVLKGGKVSCACCEACCLYPAELMDAEGGYTYDDLPEQLTVNGETYYKTVATPVNYEGTSGIIYIDGGEWVLYLTGDEEGFPTSANRCLITGDGNFTPGDDAVEDQFPDKLTMAGGPGLPPIIFNRVSLCKWETPGWAEFQETAPYSTWGPHFEGTVEYREFDNSWGAGGYDISVGSDVEGFQYLGSSIFNVKKGAANSSNPAEYNNSPVGTYAKDGYLTIEISEYTP